LSFRRGLCFGTLGAALTAGVAACRVSAGTAAFLPLLGGAALFFGPTLAGVSAARPLSPLLRALLVGLGLSALPLAKLASLLKVTTHHRPLGAVTFAVLGLVVCLGAIAVCARVLAVSDASRSTVARVARTALIAFAVVSPLLLLARATASANLREGVFDVALGLGTGALLSLAPWPSPALRWLELSALPLWLGTVLLGILVGLASAGAPAELASPVLVAPISWILH
jgi:hypothetical protein